MSARALGAIAIAIGALMAVFLWRAGRADEASSDEAVRPARAADLTPAPTPATPATPAAPHSPPSPSSSRLASPSAPAPPNPSLPAAIDPRESELAGEPRDPAWAATTERELRDRFRAIRGGHLTDAECRTRLCRMIVVGSRAEIGRTIAELGGAHGLHGYASAVVLSPPEVHADGNLALRAYARFSR